MTAPTETPTETPSLTTEQAGGLASRWAFWHTGLKQCADNAELDREMAKAPMLLAAPEVGQLFAWVRAWMADRKRAGNYDACVGEALGLDDIDAAHALAHDAAHAPPPTADCGWPS